MTALELDVTLTSDGELMIHHDPFSNPSLCRNDDGSRIRAVAIHRLTAEYLRKLDCGSQKNSRFPQQKEIPRTRLMTLDDFFAQLKDLEQNLKIAGEVIINIDVKFAPGAKQSDVQLKSFAALLMRKISSAEMTARCMVQSFETRLLPFIKEISPGTRTAALFQGSKLSGAGKRTADSMVRRVLEIKADIIAPYYRDTDFKLVRLAHKNGLTVIPWTVNLKGEMRMLLQMGVDGLISDYPDRLKAVADEASR